MAEKVLAYDRAIVPQETGWWCGPASVLMLRLERYEGDVPARRSSRCLDHHRRRTGLGQHHPEDQVQLRGSQGGSVPHACLNSVRNDWTLMDSRGPFQLVADVRGLTWTHLRGLIIRWSRVRAPVAPHIHAGQGPATPCREALSGSACLTLPQLD